MKLAAILFIALFWLSCGPKVDRIDIKGSDTEVNLALQLAETYMQRNTDVSISVSGGGSGLGIASLVNKRTDIANSSREMKDDELNLARERGLEPLAVIFAVDGLAFIVHPENLIRQLSLEQLGKVYQGEISNWQQIGGANQRITLYGRQSNSGTYGFVRENIVKADYSNRMRQMSGTAQIIEAVKQDASGIGYVGIGYVVNDEGNLMPGIQVLNVEVNGEPVSPTARENITSGRYPVTRPLYQFVDKSDTSRVLKQFIAYELSPEGQQIVSENGYFPITKQHQEHNARLGFGNE